MGDSKIIEALMAWLQTVSAADIAIFIIVLVAVGGFIAKKLWPWLVTTAGTLLHISRALVAVNGLAAFIIRTDASLAAQDIEILSIKHETHTNNGSSIKDAVGRSEKILERQERTMNETVLPELSEMKQLHVTLRNDIESLRNAKTTTTVEVVTDKRDDLAMA